MGVDGRNVIQWGKAHKKTHLNCRTHKAMHKERGWVVLFVLHLFVFWYLFDRLSFINRLPFLSQGVQVMCMWAF